MKRLFFLPFAALCAVILMQCTNASAPAAEEAAAPQPTHEDTVKRGEYLIAIMGCHDCHSPKRLDANGNIELVPDRMLSGYDARNAYQVPNLEATKQGFILLNPDFTSFLGPWGVSFAANITSDETGIGNWSLDQFKKAFKQGKYMGLDAERMLLPPMPWFNMGNITEEDVSAIFTYLKSTNPVRNVPPPPIPPDQLAQK